VDYIADGQQTTVDFTLKFCLYLSTRDRGADEKTLWCEWHTRCWWESPKKY